MIRATLKPYFVHTKKAWIKYGWAITMVIWMTIGSILIPYPQSKSETDLTLYLLAYAVFSVAGLLGFMLGIPKFKKKDNSTNLEQISDWLTKLLLGAGLVELKPLIETTWYFSGTLGAEMNVSFGKFIAFFIILASGSLGIITGYLWSQLHFERKRTDDRNWEKAQDPKPSGMAMPGSTDNAGVSTPIP
jgi:hypothetical protein